jgi:16S rRNA (adenine1518-N6/adenine1519-N6)-dimethyltransferase
MTHPGQLLKANRLYAGKELGQNFLSDPNTADSIIRKTGIDENCHVLEIGPGLGALTIPIARKTRHLTAVEKDSRLIPLLEKELESHQVSHVNIINQDVLKLDIKTIAGEKTLVVIGNLPYNISSQIIFKLVKERGVVKTAFLMFQKELANRMMARPGGREYSRLAAVVQYAATVECVAHIKPSFFFPRPDVDSTILRFDFFNTRPFDHAQEANLFNVIKAAFSKRRKSLKNSMLGGEFNYDKKMILTALKKAQIDQTRRAETLSVEEFKTLAQAVWETMEHPE